MSLALLGIGTASPQFAMNQRDAAEVMKTFCCYDRRQARLLDTIFNHSEVKRRSSVILEAPDSIPILERETFFPPARDEADRGPTTAQRMRRYAKELPPLAIEASRTALERAGLPPREITHLITVSCTGFVAPGIDVALITQLELPPTTVRTQIGFMGCHAAINGMRVACGFAGADPHSRVLLCAAELCSLHFYYGWDVEKVKANALFADGAAAVVAAPAEGDPPWRVVATGSYLFAQSENTMGWNIGNNGFEMTLAAEVPDLIQAHLGEWLVPWLAQHHLRPEDVASWAIHPGGPRIVSAVASCFGLSEAAVATSRQVLAEHGNMSSPTILFILERLRRGGASLPCLALGFGPGLEAEAALIM